MQCQYRLSITREWRLQHRRQYAILSPQSAQLSTLGNRPREVFLRRHSLSRASSVGVYNGTGLDTTTTFTAARIDHRQVRRRHFDTFDFPPNTSVTHGGTKHKYSSSLRSLSPAGNAVSVSSFMESNDDNPKDALISPFVHISQHYNQRTTSTVGIPHNQLRRPKLVNDIKFMPGSVPRELSTLDLELGCFDEEDSEIDSIDWESDDQYSDYNSMEIKEERQQNESTNNWNEASNPFSFHPKSKIRHDNNLNSQAQGVEFLSLLSHGNVDALPNILDDDIYADDFEFDEEEDGEDSVSNIENLKYPTPNVDLGDDVETSTSTNKSLIEYIASFDPQNPPTSGNFEELEAWLECESQHEAVIRFQKVIDDARARKDYSSLSMVQRQMVQWFPALQEEITKRQRSYILKDDRSDGKHRYGPFLCALPPSKLAIITAHEAIMHTLMKGNNSGISSSNGNNGKDRRQQHDGVPFISLVTRIGEAVEEEVVIHRVLHKRYKDAQRRLSKIPKNAPSEETNPLISEEDGMNYFGLHMNPLEISDNEDGQGRSKEMEAVSKSLKDNVTHKWAYAASHLKSYLDEISQSQPSAKKRRVIKYAIRRARAVLDRDEAWSVEDRIQLGTALFQMLLNTATVKVSDENTRNSKNFTTEPAFTYEKRWTKKDKTQAFVILNDRLYNMIANDKLQSFGITTTRFKPMIVPPKPWTKLNEGGYRILRADLMRFHGCNTQKDVLRYADLSTVFDGLNALGRVKWKINKCILEVAQQCWDNNIPLGDIPTRTDYDLPPEPVQPKFFEGIIDKDNEAFKMHLEEQRQYQDALARYNRLKQKNMDLRSLRCSATLKLDQAQKFQNFDCLYFPYNVDFRGRAYPIPPHLSNVGSDLCRGILMFAEPKPLTERGFYWLKVHLANFAGKDKMTFDDRAAYVDENIDRIRESVRDPFGGDRWWMSLEDPFQGLATCREIVAAIDSGDPASYMCSLPVHMDGSCNGLQHYAALGRDKVGGTAVNLCATNEPQDVYVGVMHEVIKRIAAEAERHLDFDASDLSSLTTQQRQEFYNNRSAKLVNGLIDRGVVKRTVMTSVYGVTYIGARKQIQEKIEDKLESLGHDIDGKNVEIFQACGYLAKVTMDTIGDLFSGAKGTMNWLTTCARMISQHGYPVAWISPIGLPAIQPYRQKKSATLVTLMQTVTLTSEGDDLPIHRQRQVSAFPPNYIHSLDSSHMLLTALEMDRRGLTFSAVHDSFWTHPCDIDEMNSVLRDVFVELYSQPLLERLKETWQMRYPDLNFPDLPDRGTLDLTEVRDAVYFFQ